MPGVSATVGEQIEALRRVAALGFTAERDFEEIIRVHLEDEHGEEQARRPGAPG